MSSKAYYGVEIGKIPGIYTTWASAKEQVDGFSGECHKGFETLEQCVDFMIINGRHTEGTLRVFGPRGGQYSLRDWKRKQDSVDSDNTTVKQIETSDNSTDVTETAHNDQAQHDSCNKVIGDVLKALKKINERLDVMDNRERRLTTLLEEKTQQCDKLTIECSSLQGKVTDLTLKVHEETWKSLRATKSSAISLVIGSSIIRDVKEDQLIDTKVISKSGARIKNLCEVVDNLPHGDKYDSVTVVSGGNDCDNEAKPDVIVQSYKTLGDKLKVLTPALTVSSICPRTTSDGISDKIKSVNAGLQVLCADEGWTFINNDPSFHLGDGQINDGYLTPDGVHLTRKATNRLAQNLKLRVKDLKAGVCGAPRDKQLNTTRHTQHRTDDNRVQERQDVQEDDLNISHSFWNNSHRKATSPTTRRGHNATVTRQNSQRDRTTSERQTPCYHCGEENHNVRRCRYSYRLECKTCGEEGHKAKHHERRDHY